MRMKYLQKGLDKSERAIKAEEKGLISGKKLTKLFGYDIILSDIEKYIKPLERHHVGRKGKLESYFDLLKIEFVDIWKIYQLKFDYNKSEYLASQFYMKNIEPLINYDEKDKNDTE